MSISSSVSSTHPLSYLQSLMSSASAGANAPADPLSSFLASNSSTASASGAPAARSTSPSPTGGFSPFDANTLGALISLQGQQTSSASDPSSLFAQLDTDGSISKSEFGSAFGSNSDSSKLAALSGKLDANG